MWNERTVYFIGKFLFWHFRYAEGGTRLQINFFSKKFFAGRRSRFSSAINLAEHRYALLVPRATHAGVLLFAIFHYVQNAEGGTRTLTGFRP